VGRPSTEDLETEDLDLPEGDEPEDDGGVGVDDADELLLSDLRDEPEDVGLDTETAGSADALSTQLLDLDDEAAEGSLVDDTPLELDADIDAEGDEHGWTEGSEGAGNEPWDESESFDFDEEAAEDGGEEGVDDPLLDGLPEELPRPPESAEDDDEGVIDGSLDDLVREIGTDA
jgi:hypothetical protein